MVHLKKDFCGGNKILNVGPKENCFCSKWTDRRAGECPHNFFIKNISIYQVSEKT